MCMDGFFKLFEMGVVEFDLFESFLEIFGIYPMMMVSGFLLFFEKIEHAFTIVLEKDHKYYNYDGDDKNQ